ncbi:MAG: T9SS type A sorting domain-containing protein [Lentimicrobiaceae bacterium]|nr:T9SS type A sorting domain-containing protein [Lentimicrobiaceae bacterium]
MKKDILRKLLVISMLFNIYVVAVSQTATYAPPPVPPYPPTYYISGPATICSQASYTIANLPYGTTVTWSVGSNNLQLVSGQGTSTATYAKTGNGASKIRAYVNYGTVRDKGVWVGVPSGLSIVTNNPNHLQVGEIRTYFLSPNPGSPTSYQWWVTGVNGLPDNGLNILPGSGSSSMVEAMENGFYFINAKSENSCGWSNATSKAVMVRDNDGDIPALSIAPNPANNYIGIELDITDGCDKGSNKKEFFVEIFNNDGLCVFSESFINNKFKINTSNLPSGLYQMRLLYNKNVYKEQIMIKH